MKHIHERDLLKRWEEIADLLPKFAKIDIGIDYIELILCYTLTRIKQSDIIEVEKILQSKLNPKKREKIMGSIAHHWLQEGRKEVRAEGREEKNLMVKEMKKEGISIETIMKITKLSE